MNYKATIIILALLISSSEAFSEDSKWTNTDTAMLVTSSALIVADWNQTLHIARNPNQYYEADPLVYSLIGKHPTTKRVNLLCAASLIGNAIIGYTLHAPYRDVWFGFIIVTESAVVASNRNIGLGLSLHF